jgi:nucleotide-binding universal stress UspA family protein
MFSKILVPLDGSEAAEAALPYAIECARTFGCQVEVAGVGIGIDNELSRPYLAYLEKKTASLRDKGIATKAILLQGSPADELLKYIEQNDVDLVAMTTYGRSGARRWLVGGIAARMMGVVVIPALFVPPYQQKGKLRIKKILAPLDGEDEGKTALPYVEELARKMQASVTLLQVVSPLAPMALEAMDGNMVKAMEAEALKRGREYLGGVARELSDKGIDVRPEVLSGDPASVILDYAENEDIDMIAMPTHGRKGFSRWLLGEVSRKVVTVSCKPVLIVREAKVQ